MNTSQTAGTRTVYLSRTPTPGALPVPQWVLSEVLSDAERMAAIRAISNGPIKGGRS